MNKNEINDLLGPYAENLKIGEKEEILADVLHSRLQDAIDLAAAICDNNTVVDNFSLPTPKVRVAQLRNDLIEIRNRLNTMKRLY